VTFPRELETERLRLTAWSRDDGEALAAINAHPDVLRHVPPVDRAGSFALAERLAAHWTALRFGLWALRERGRDDVIGFAGLSIPVHVPEVFPSVEVGWRLRRDAWGRGFATEAGRAALEHGFAALGLREVVCLVHSGNARSLATAARLGLEESRRVREVVVLSLRR